MVIVLALVLAGLVLAWLVGSVQEARRQAHWRAVLDQMAQARAKQLKDWQKAHPGQRYDDSILMRVGVMPAPVEGIWGGDIVLLDDGRVLHARDLMSLHLGPNSLPLTLDPDALDWKTDPHPERYAVPSRYVGFSAYVWSDEAATRFGLYQPPGLPNPVLFHQGSRSTATRWRWSPVLPISRWC